MPLPPRRVLRTFKYAMYFNGVNAYVVNTGFKWSVLRDGFTIVLWINTFDRDSDILRHYTAPQGYFNVRYRMDYKRVAFAERSTDTNEIYGLTGSDFKNPPGVWNNAVLTWDTVQGCWYANGVFDRCSSDARTGKGMDYTGFYIAKAYYSNNYQGYVSQLLMYSRVLSSGEIQQNYLYPDNPVRNGLVLWLQAHPDYVKDIDGDGRLEWIDLSGFNNHGKIYGAQLVQLVKTPARVLTLARVLKPAR